MQLTYVLAWIAVCFSAFPLHSASAEELKGAARRDYEKVTSEGSFYTSCSLTKDFVFWSGRTPSMLDVDGKQQPVQFEAHKIGDYVKKPFQCQTPQGLLSITTKLTHSISNAQCGAGNRYVATVSVAHLGSYSDLFLVDGCFNTLGFLITGKHVLLCNLPYGNDVVVAHCAEGADAKGPRILQ